MKEYRTILVTKKTWELLKELAKLNKRSIITTIEILTENECVKNKK